MKTLPIYNITLDDEMNGVFAVSLVDRPAIDSLFIKLEKDQHFELFSAQEDQHIVYGCVLRADYPIYREDPNLGPHYIMFSKEIIKEIAEKFMKQQNGQNVDLNHDFKYIDGCYVTLLFIKDVEKGIDPKGFESIEDGSLFAQYKVEDDALWELIKLGEFAGFSIEGNFTRELMLNKLTETTETFDDWMESIIKQK